MKWKDHIRLAYQLAAAYGLEEFAKELADGSVEPDKKRTVVHVWPRARGAARREMYQARRAFLKGDMARCAFRMGVVTHFIEDGMVHGTMAYFSHSQDHSTVEGDIGARSDITSLELADAAREGMMDGEFVFQEIDGLVREGLSNERLARALSLLASAVLRSPDAPPEVEENHRHFLKEIGRPVFKIIGAGSLLLAALAAFFLHDPFWLFLLPFSLLLTGRADIFRLLARYGWFLLAGPLLRMIYYLGIRFDYPALIIILLIAAQTLYLFLVPDPGKWSEKWYRL
jgi:hypothetical protein